MAASTEERLIEAESRLMHLERLLEQLNCTVVEQGVLLDRLGREVVELRNEAQGAEESD